MNRTKRRLLALLAAAAAAVMGGTQVRADLRPEQVLVIYDSRIPDSLAVAEYYAGSAAVAGVNNRPGTRKGVRVFDLATTGLGQMGAMPDINREQFRTRLRNPIRAWLNANDSAGVIRCLVTTRGIPFRLADDSANLFIGDNPSNAANSFVAGTYSASSIDSELTLLWQNLDGTDTAQTLTFHNGAIISPYWAGRLSAGQTQVNLSVLPISAWSTARRKTVRAFSAQGTGLASGVFWGASVLNTPNSSTVPPVTAITPGDMYLVSRLDAGTLNGVFAMLDRSVNITVNVDTATLVLDESASDGVANSVDNAEYDNSGYPGGVSSPP